MASESLSTGLRHAKHGPSGCLTAVLRWRRADAHARQAHVMQGSTSSAFVLFGSIFGSEHAMLTETLTCYAVASK